MQGIACYFFLLGIMAKELLVTAAILSSSVINNSKRRNRYKRSVILNQLYWSQTNVWGEGDMNSDYTTLVTSPADQIHTIISALNCTYVMKDHNWDKLFFPIW